MALRSNLCIVCHKRQKYIDGSKIHPFCGKQCANKMKIQASPSMSTIGNCSVCHIRPKYVDGTTIHDYCSRTCAAKVPKPAVIPQPQSSTKPRLEELQAHGLSFAKLKDEIDRTANNTIKVAKVFRVVDSRASRTLLAYRQKLAASGPVDQIRTFHSSQCMCNLGYKDSKFCNGLSCGICRTVESSFKYFAFGVQYNTGKHGNGIYSYLNPAEADRHSTSCTSSPYRVMVCCDAVIGKADKSWSSLLLGASSVVDNDQVFVNNPDAINARYVILYTLK